MPSEAWLRKIDALVADAVGDQPEYEHDSYMGYGGTDVEPGYLARRLRRDFPPHYHASWDAAMGAAGKEIPEET